jgi:anti-sigma regulatory factor (Ser/Thr protein kinase)/CheY-like chemotaxis protein
LKKELGPVSINELLAEIDNQNALIAEHAGVELRLIPSDLVVKTDRALLGTMLQNLVSNAIKYAPGKKVVVGCRRNAKRVSIHILDSGRGISQGDLKHVREEFYRSSSKSKLGTDNKGLGLAIVNRLAVMLGLQFNLSSEEGKGTSASILGLPLATGKSFANEAQQAKKLPLSGTTVVLAEDDEETLKSTQKLLEQWGCEVRALNRFPNQARPCDIVLSDFDFGERGTLADHKVAISNFIDTGTKLILVSGHHPDTIRDALPGLTDLILSKPVRAAELRSALLSARVG